MEFRGLIDVRHQIAGALYGLGQTGIAVLEGVIVAERLPAGAILDRGSISLEIMVDLPEAGTAVLVLEIELQPVADFQVHIVAAGKDGLVRLCIFKNEILAVGCIRRGIRQFQGIAGVQFAGADNLAGCLGCLAEEVVGRNDYAINSFGIVWHESRPSVVLAESSFEKGGTGLKGERRIFRYMVHCIGRPAGREHFVCFVQILENLEHHVSTGIAGLVQVLGIR